MGIGSGWHWIIVLLVIILLFGGKKLPELAKGLGKGIKTFKKEMADDTTAKPVNEIDELADNTKKTEANEVKSEQKA
ncbi:MULTISPECIES: twin-arginine translocase TatA/TatE family subunit [unclassified Campylobacter]|uniref:twin-arginine translocase TatA/TatE family subunit n=1 Tax=unclassified Campylobacter TaxID=2593542 RepID=UPI001BDAAB9E|nr:MULTISPECIES: twin-arginine translocase TatA/TatE family subunit [unclassified Campylobacter]MBZ7975285.1 twin-arginine translocase TatA/TatE family subunit [Campylobacter sp. RM12637]MBZ7978385.1 twin-arginine translocase TatA/TatE family subunit [Campylobacter sp. RM12654]MBZ7979018.1 twin-arginine translocase TatA/TatE family subunit [Campylobacter sp. RM12642]MBZ7981637.1 twin-arginine translocase TatA/TatE family subunit [Campylobacter sp. RM12640]MBZ7984358.1 twin-arginine translocase